MSVSQNQYLTFKLSEEIFALNVKDVKEVVEYKKMTIIPGLPDCFSGVYSLRGQPLMIIDLKKIFRFEPSPITVDTCIVVIEMMLNEKETNAGLIVDKVLEVIQLDGEEMEKGTEKGEKGYSKYVKGLIKRNEDFTMVIDVNKLLTMEDFKIILERAGG